MEVSYRSSNKEDFFELQRHRMAWGCVPTQQWEFMYYCLKQGATLVRGDKEVSITTGMVPTQRGNRMIFYLIDKVGQRIGVAEWPKEFVLWFRDSNDWYVNGEKIDVPEQNNSPYLYL